MSKDEHKRALFCGLPSACDVTTEHILGSNLNFDIAIDKLIVRKSRILQHEEHIEVALQVRHNNKAKKCFTCSKPGHFAKSCKRNEKGFRCDKAAHITKNYRNSPADDKRNDGTAMITIHQSLVAKREKAKSSDWILD